MIPSYPHTYHWPESLSVHRDDHYHTDPDHFVGVDVVITEKLDGGLTWIHDNQVYARSSGAPTRQPWFSYVKSVTVPKIAHLWSPQSNLCLVGEDLFGIHSIEYNELPDSFFLFHILEREDMDYEGTEFDHFLSWDSVTYLAKDAGLHHVPVLFEGKFSSQLEITKWFMDEVKKPSTYGTNREGFVMRRQHAFPFNEFEQHMCKFVRANHVQTNQRWEYNWRKAKITKP